MKNRQQGSAHMVVIIVLVLGLLTALGWIFYQNFIYKEPTKKDTELVVVDKSKKSDTGTDATKYHDFRTDNKDTTGVVMAAEGDVDKLTDAGSALKAYFKANAGMAMDGMTMKYTVDRLKGNYAAGVDNMTSAYLLWGPKDGTGAIMNVAGTQNEGFPCSDLEAAKVPSELVDGKCIAEGKGLVDYKG